MSVRASPTPALFPVILSTWEAGASQIISLNATPLTAKPQESINNDWPDLFRPIRNDPFIIFMNVLRQI